MPLKNFLSLVIIFITFHAFAQLDNAHLQKIDSLFIQMEYT